MPPTLIKICGVTSVRDAIDCVDEGADAIGVNFWAGSVRRCDEGTASDIVEVVGKRALVVGVFVDESVAEIRRIRANTGVAWAQLHGSEPPETVAALLPSAYKAIRVGGPDAVDEVRRYPGEHVLLDASVPGMAGGTGATFDWSVAAPVARERLLTLAGGLTPENVAKAIAVVAPHRVDVASGVERAPGVKDIARVRAFVDAVRRAGG